MGGGGRCFTGPHLTLSTIMPRYHRLACALQEELECGAGSGDRFSMPPGHQTDTSASTCTSILTLTFSPNIIVSSVSSTSPNATPPRKCFAQSSLSSAPVNHWKRQAPTLVRQSFPFDHQPIEMPALSAHLPCSCRYRRAHLC